MRPDKFQKQWNDLESQGYNSLSEEIVFCCVCFKPLLDDEQWGKGFKFYCSQTCYYRKDMRLFRSILALAKESDYPLTGLWIKQAFQMIGEGWERYLSLSSIRLSLPSIHLLPDTQRKVQGG